MLEVLRNKTALNVELETWSLQIMYEINRVKTRYNIQVNIIDIECLKKVQTYECLVHAAHTLAVLVVVNAVTVQADVPCGVQAGEGSNHDLAVQHTVSVEHSLAHIEQDCIGAQRHNTVQIGVHHVTSGVFNNVTLERINLRRGTVDGHFVYIMP